MRCAQTTGTGGSARISDRGAVGKARQESHATGPRAGAVERQSGGMSSHFDFEGLFVSLLLSIPDGAIWDARAESAS